ncbi:MAG: DUF5329 family protein [Nannocystaceae bacterium]
MFGRRATAREASRRTAEDAGLAGYPLALVVLSTLGLGAAGLVTACGAPNPRILDATEQARGMPSEQLGNEMTEQQKIAALIDAVRRSEHTFVNDDIERGGAAAADKMQLLLERDPTGVRSAREFIDRIAAPERTDEPADRVVVSEEESMLAKTWFHARLADLEGRPAPPAAPEEVREAQEHARRLQILDALRVVERSDLRFVSPSRKAMPKAAGKKSAAGPVRTRKPKRKEYTGQQFADMLRKKWEFLGADIHDVETFIEEIASDSFASMVRYRVIHPDGSEQDFSQWLRAQLDLEREALAQGGAP